MEDVYHDSIDTPRQFVEALVRSTLTHRAASPGCNLMEINVGGANVFDFNMEYEEKVRLFNIGYDVIKNVK
jgi:hypothetical protein